MLKSEVTGTKSTQSASLEHESNPCLPVDWRTSSPASAISAAGSCAMAATSIAPFSLLLLCSQQFRTPTVFVEMCDDEVSRIMANRRSGSW